MSVQKHKLFGPGKVPGLDGTGPRAPEGPVVPWLNKSKSPGTWKSEKSRDNGNPSAHLWGQLIRFPRYDYNLLVVASSAGQLDLRHILDKLT